MDEVKAVNQPVDKWGVLHHTGNMWQAMENGGRLVERGGLFVIGIYKMKQNVNCGLGVSKFVFRNSQTRRDE
jgi:hypothetical protein